VLWIRSGQIGIISKDPNPDSTICTFFHIVPHVFGPPGSGFTSQRLRILLSSCKNSKKNLDSYNFVTLFDILSLKNYVNVLSKSNKQKKLC
jgi:hypothetical protein